MTGVSYYPGGHAMMEARMCERGKKDCIINVERDGKVGIGRTGAVVSIAEVNLSAMSSQETFAIVVREKEDGGHHIIFLISTSVDAKNPTD